MSLHSFGSPSPKVATTPPSPPDETSLFRLSKSSIGRSEPLTSTQSFVDEMVRGAIQESTGLRGFTNLLVVGGILNRASRLISVGRASMAAAESAPALESWLLRTSPIASRLTEWGTQFFRNPRWTFSAASIPLVGSLFFTTGCQCGNGSSKPTPSQTASSPLPSDPWDLKSSGNMKVRVDLEGDLKLNERVLFIRNRHWDKNFEKDPDTRLAFEVGNYQLKVWELLERLRPQHIFVENYSRDYPPEDLYKLEEEPGEFDEVRIEFKRGGIFTKKRILMAGLYGAELIYPIRHNDVYLHRTLAPEEKGILSECDKAINETAVLVKTEEVFDPVKKKTVLVARMKINLDHPRVKNCFDQREKLAVREIIQFLKAHPKEKVVLIYGVNHNFCDDFARENFKPRLTSVWWEGITSFDHPVPEACK